MYHIGILKAAHHMHNGVYLADIRQKLISKSLALGGAFHQSCNVHKFDDRRRYLLGMVKISQKPQPSHPAQ